MNTDKIYAEHIANEYSAKKESKVIALKKLDRKAKLPADIFVYTNGIIMSLIFRIGNEFIYECYWKWKIYSIRHCN